MRETKNQHDDQLLLEKQVEPLFNSTLSGGLANIFAACLVFFLLMDSRIEVEAFLSCCLIVFVSLIRIAFSKLYLSGSKVLVLNSHLKIHICLTFIIGMSWAFLEFIQHTPEDEAIRNIVYLINFGLIAGSITTLSTYKPAYLAYMLPQAIAIFSVFIVADNDSSFYMAFAFFIFMAIMVATSFNINKSHKNEMELIVNNKALIVDLNNEIQVRTEVQQELETHKNELECKVIERTRELSCINSDLEKVIAKKEEAEQSLQYLAYHDELTNLPNKNLLIDRVNHSIESAYRNRCKLGILFIDLDRFKTINDSLGHTVGDKLIKEVAARLKEAFRKEDTVSRNGGDEFVVVINKMINANEAILIAQKLIDRLTEIFEIDSHKIHIGASIGISMYPNDGRNALELLRNADTAMFAAKNSGGNRLQFYDESMSNRLRRRLEIENELHSALNNNEFYLVYQPQVNCISGETVGFEALMRWSNNELGNVSPADFIPLLEETGLIYDVGKWVVSEVAHFIASGIAGHSTVAINLSALQCGDLKLIEHVQEAIDELEISASQIEFEITESVLIHDFEETQRFLNMLHDVGCSIALDDFGTGYTSMSYLTRLPIDGIKIDQSFVRDIHKEKSLEDIVRAIIYMSSSLGITNKVEGVETEDELATIKKLGGEIIQGYFYSRPIMTSDVQNWLESNRIKQQVI